MSNTKKYYWLKLNENFFEDDTIQFIEEQENGILYSNFYMKLCLKSLKQEGTLVRVVGETLIPYDIKSLSKLTGVPVDTVTVAMDLFTKIGLIKKLESGEIYLSQIKEMIGSETDKAKSMRMLRAKRNDKGNNVTKMLPDVTEKLPEIEIELEIEKEIEKDKKSIAKAISPAKQYLKRYKEFIVNSIPDVNIQVLDSQVMRLKQHIDDNLFAELEKSSYLKGLKDKKPGVWVFTVVKNINDIKLGVYRDKEASQEEKNTPSRRVL